MYRKRIRKHFSLPLLGFLAAVAAAGPGSTSLHAEVAIQPDQHLAFIGGTFADWLQHEPTLEAMLYTAFPEQKITVRHLGFSGDEITKRARSDGFGSPDEWLKKVKADVVVAAFGFNESFAGPAGLPKFREDLTKFIRDTKGKNYSGKAAPQLALLSPTAWENLKNPDFTDGVAENARIEPYVRAMEEIAKAEQVTFVNLFSASQQAFAAAKAPLTVNGIHFRESGYQALAPAIFQGLTGKPVPAVADKKDLREAIAQKNHQWHARYRTVDGYNVYGGRSGLAYKDKNSGRDVTNNEIMQQEMLVRDQLTENRDKVVWEAAQGRKVKPEDGNLPPVAQITSNLAGENPDGSFKFPSGEEMIPKIQTSDPKLKLKLFADETRFPELVNPVQMNWDTKGRLWVAAWNHYPERPPVAATGDHLLIFEDTDGDGKADKMTKFFDQLNCPTGFQFVNGGVLVIQAPDVWLIQDTNGDDRGDKVTRIFAGLDSADSHHQTNAICYEPGGALFFSDGVFHRTQSETLNGVFRNSDAGIYRYEPRTGKFGSYMLYGFANPHGRVFDRWGNDFITDATGNNTYFGPAGSVHLRDGEKHDNLKQFWDRPSRPCPGTGIVSSRHFPDDWQGDFLNLNVITFQGIYRVDMEAEGSGIWGKSAPDLLWSKETVFRPSCISTGPDGAMFLCDWSNAIIGHMQHHLRDPNRDKQHGRIYKLTYEGRPLLKPKKIYGADIPALLDLLKEPEDGTRTLAKLELERHPVDAVVSATQAWAAGLDAQDPEYAHHLCEALWVHQWQNRVNIPLLEKVLAMPDHRARAAGTRVLCYWRDRVPNALARLKVLANDTAPTVRLHAVRAASFFDTWEAADVALESLKQPQDYYLEYVFKATMRQLKPVWQAAVTEGKELASGNPKGVEYLLGNVSTPELLKMPKRPGTLTALLLRPDVMEADRILAASDLAGLTKKSSTSVMLETLLAGLDGGGKGVDELAKLLLRQPAGELTAVKSAFEKLLQPEQKVSDTVRQMALAALLTANGSVEAAWKDAGNSARAFTNFLGAVNLLTDATLRTAAAAKIRPLVEKLPDNIVTELQGSATRGRYVRVDLPRAGTLTIAEVEIFSDGKNVGPKAKATQSSTSNDGVAQRALDGNTSGTYGNAGQTHTVENERNPWWEADLGSELPIEKIVIWNRNESDGVYVNRLDGYNLTLLDGNRQPIISLKKNAAKPQPVSHVMQGDPLGSAQRSAIRALVSTGDAPQETFKTLAKMVKAGNQRLAAAQGLMQLPRATWDKAAAGTAAQSLLAWAKATSPEVRTAQEFLELSQAASEFASASTLAPEAATALNKELRSLGVSVFVLKCVREQMRYNQARLVVEAGKPFDVIFENDDAMPHNLVFSQPGSKDALGTAAQTMNPQQKDSKGRSMIPNDARIFAASKLLENSESERLTVKAPDQLGSYDYFCTFPGHSMIMWGRLEVVKDVDAFLQANPKPTVVPPTFVLPSDGK